MLRMQRQGAPDGNDCFQIAVAHTPPSATLSTGARGSWFTNGLALSDDCYLMAHRTLGFLKNWNFHVSPVTSPPSGCIRGTSQKGGDDRTHAPHDAARKVVHGACGRRCGSDGGAAGLKRDKRKHGPPLHAQCKYNTTMNAGNSRQAPKAGRPARPNQKAIRRTTSSCGVREKGGPLHLSL